MDRVDCDNIINTFVPFPKIDFGGLNILVHGFAKT